MEPPDPQSVGPRERRSEASNMTRQLAASEDPLHKFKMDGAWAAKTEKVPDNLYKKIGVEKPSTPRRL